MPAPLCTPEPDFRLPLSAGARAGLARIRAALAGPGADTSDYDLNEGRGAADPAHLRPAAVLLGLVPAEGDLDVVLTTRAGHLRHHAGQVAFPGGKVETADADLVACALREAHEEIGLEPSQVRILGAFAAHETVTGYHVTPIVAVIDPGFRPRPDPGEVAEVFRVPLAHLADAGAYRIEQRHWRGTWRRYYTVPYGPYYIWGATARILRALADGMANADHGGLDQG